MQSHALQTLANLKALIAELSDALTDEGPDWSQEGLDSLRKRVANTLGPECPTWLDSYRDPIQLVSRASFKPDADELYEKARAFVLETQNGSVSHLQRHMGIVYNRAARLIEGMETDGLLLPPDENGKRRIHPDFKTNT